jgi:hypothetical protein
MLRRFNIYYIGSTIILFVMFLIFARYMQSMGLSIWQQYRPPAIVWGEGLLGNYQISHLEVDSSDALAMLQVVAIDSLKPTLNGQYVLGFKLYTGDDSLSSLGGVLALNDFEDRQILVEWYSADQKRQDGCELLFLGDTAAFMGSTIGEMCYPDLLADEYAILSLAGNRNEFGLELQRYAVSNDSLISEQRYRLTRKVLDES